MTTTPEFWRKCSSCKKPILFQQKYFECSVSTCQGARTGYVFCSIPCWEVHLPGAKHRNAGAIEKKSPTLQQFLASQETEPAAASGAAPGSAPVGGPQRRIIVSTPAAGVPAAGIKTSSSMSNEVLVVVSKMKQFIRDISDMNTADEVSQILSDRIRVECERAVENARADGRKTVMGRDFSKTSK